MYQKKPPFDMKNALMGFGLLIAAVPFFVAGLDDDNDPYRLYHGCWHLFGGLSAFYLWRVVKNHITTTGAGSPTGGFTVGGSWPSSTWEKP
jgi:hypothetical protein